MWCLIYCFYRHWTSVASTCTCTLYTWTLHMSELHEMPGIWNIVCECNITLPNAWASTVAPSWQIRARALRLLTLSNSTSTVNTEREFWTALRSLSLNSGSGHSPHITQTGMTLKDRTSHWTLSCQLDSLSQYQRTEAGISGVSCSDVWDSVIDCGGTNLRRWW